MWQDQRQHPTQRAVMPGTRIRLLDMRARMIHQMHVVHPGRASRHAGKTRQAAVDVLDGFLVGRAIVLQHVLDQVDAATRRVQLIPQHLIGGTGRSAKTAVDTGP